MCPNPAASFHSEPTFSLSVFAVAKEILAAMHPPLEASIYSELFLSLSLCLRPGQTDNPQLCNRLYSLYSPWPNKHSAALHPPGYWSGEKFCSFSTFGKVIGRRADLHERRRGPHNKPR